MQGRLGAFNRTDLPTYKTQTAVLGPFTVIRGTSTQAGGAKITIIPGTVLGVMPQISTINLDVPPPASPPTLSFTNNGIVCLRVNIEGFSDTFRPAITSIEVKKFNGTQILDDNDDALAEITMIWDNEETKSSGYFYIKIAQIICTIPDNSPIPVISTIYQFLNKNVYSFIIVVDDIIILTQ